MTHMANFARASACRRPILKTMKLIFWGRELTVGCPVVVSPLPREWSCWYRRRQGGLSFLEEQRFFGVDGGEIGRGMLGQPEMAVPHGRPVQSSKRNPWDLPHCQLLASQ